MQDPCCEQGPFCEYIAAQSGMAERNPLTGIAEYHGMLANYLAYALGMIAGLLA